MVHISYARDIKSIYNEGLLNLIDSGPFSDFAFRCSDITVRAHRVILALRSDYIRNLNASEISVPVNGASVRLLLQLLYFQFVPIRHDQLQDLQFLLTCIQTVHTVTAARDIENFDHNTYDYVITLGNDPEAIRHIQLIHQNHQNVGVNNLVEENIPNREENIPNREENIPNREENINGPGADSGPSINHDLNPAVTRTSVVSDDSRLAESCSSGSVTLHNLGQNVSRAGPSGVHKSNHPGNSNYPCSLIRNESANNGNIIHDAAQSNDFTTNSQRLPSSQIPHITAASGHDVENKPSTSNSVNYNIQFSDATRTDQPRAGGNVQPLDRTAPLPTSTSLNNIACEVAEHPQRVQRTIISEATRPDSTVARATCNCQPCSNPSCKVTIQNASKFSASNSLKQNQNTPYVAETSNQATCNRSAAVRNVMENQQAVAQPTRMAPKVDVLPSTSAHSNQNTSYVAETCNQATCNRSAAVRNVMENQQAVAQPSRTVPKVDVLPSTSSHSNQNTPYVAKTSNQATCNRSAAVRNAMENQQVIAQPTRTAPNVNVLPSTSSHSNEITPYVAETCNRSAAVRNAVENQQVVAQPTRTAPIVLPFPRTDSYMLYESRRRNGIGNMSTANSIKQNPSCSSAVNANNQPMSTRNNVIENSLGAQSHTVTPVSHVTRGGSDQSNNFLEIISQPTNANTILRASNSVLQGLYVGGIQVRLEVHDRSASVHDRSEEIQENQDRVQQHTVAQPAMHTSTNRHVLSNNASREVMRANSIQNVIPISNSMEQNLHIANENEQLPLARSDVIRDIGEDQLIVQDCTLVLPTRQMVRDNIFPSTSSNISHETTRPVSDIETGRPISALAEQDLNRNTAHRESNRTINFTCPVNQKFNLPHSHKSSTQLPYPANARFTSADTERNEIHLNSPSSLPESESRHSTRETATISASAQSEQTIETQTDFDIDDDDVVLVPHTGSTQLIITVHDSDSEESEIVTGRRINRGRRVLAVVNSQDASAPSTSRQSSHELSAEIPSVRSSTEARPTTLRIMSTREALAPLSSFLIDELNNAPSTSWMDVAGPSGKRNASADTSEENAEVEIIGVVGSTPNVYVRCKQEEEEEEEQEHFDALFEFQRAIAHIKQEKTSGGYRWSDTSTKSSVDTIIIAEDDESNSEISISDEDGEPPEKSEPPAKKTCTHCSEPKEQEKDKGNKKRRKYAKDSEAGPSSAGATTRRHKSVRKSKRNQEREPEEEQEKDKRGKGRKYVKGGKRNKDK